MKYKGYLLLFIIFFIFDINVALAETCDSDDIARLKEISNGIIYTYEYVGDGYNYQLYKVTFDNLTEELYVRYNDLNFFNGDAVIYVDSGTNKFDIYAYNCFEKKVDSIILELPKFNEYSLTDECLDIGSSNLDVCYEWFAGDLNYNQFLTEIDNYYNNVNDDFDLINFMKKNYFLLLGGIIVVIVLIVSLIVYHNKKSRLE